MFVLQSNIIIGNYQFDAVHEVEITKSVDELSDTAVIKIPSRFKVRGNGNQYLRADEAIKVGDKVSIYLGYEDKYFGLEFKGYVKKIKPTIPVEIECEDAIWLLRRKNISKSWNEKTTLKAVLEEVVKNTGLQLADNIVPIDLDKYVIKNANGAQVLQAIKDNFGLSVFITDDNKLHCGLKQITNLTQKAVYDLNYNVIKNNLEYKRKEERRVKVRYTYMGADNVKKEVEEGDADGELRTFHTTVIKDEKTLRELAKNEVERLKYDGLDGSLESFLIPFATRGMMAVIRDKEHKQHAGNYFIKKVVTKMSRRGARRIVTIGAKL